MLEMNYLNPKICFFDDEYRSRIPDKLLDFLRTLKGLTVIDIKGKDQLRCRVVTTLIHGNEPSGIIACHLWLKSLATPATNVRILICNPEAARTKPVLTNRYVAHSDDLNRFFSADKSDESAVAERARQIVSLIHEVNPEAIIDLHNTSGASPAFSVSVAEEPKHLKLAELFSEKMIFTQLFVGAIMEQEFSAPIVTIECGGANDRASHQVATNGLNQYFMQDQLFDDRKSQVSILRHPIRIELKGDTSVGFSNHQLPTTDITLRSDIEELNQDMTPKDEFIGWCDKDKPLQLKAIDDHGINQIENLFINRNGCLFTQQDMQLFMVTTVPEIATKDCLFYTTLVRTC